MALLHLRPLQVRHPAVGTLLPPAALAPLAQQLLEGELNRIGAALLATHAAIVAHVRNQTRGMQASSCNRHVQKNTPVPSTPQVRLRIWRLRRQCLTGRAEGPRPR